MIIQAKKKRKLKSFFFGHMFITYLHIFEVNNHHFFRWNISWSYLKLKELKIQKNRVVKATLLS